MLKRFLTSVLQESELENFACPKHLSLEGIFQGAAVV